MPPRLALNEAQHKVQTENTQIFDLISFPNLPQLDYTLVLFLHTGGEVG